MYVVPLPSERCTTMMSLPGNFSVRVGLDDLGIVPLRDLAEEDAGQGLGSEVELRRHARDVIDRNVGTHDRREVQHGAPRFDSKSFNCISFIGPSEAPKSTVP